MTAVAPLGTRTDGDTICGPRSGREVRRKQRQLSDRRADHAGYGAAKTSDVGKGLASAGGRRQALNTAIDKLRGGRTAIRNRRRPLDDLKRYTRDRTGGARRQLGPVIGPRTRNRAQSRCWPGGPRTIRADRRAWCRQDGECEGLRCGSNGTSRRHKGTRLLSSTWARDRGANIAGVEDDQGSDRRGKAGKPVEVLFIDEMTRSSALAKSDGAWTRRIGHTALARGELHESARPRSMNIARMSRKGQRRSSGASSGCRASDGARHISSFRLKENTASPRRADYR